MKKATTILSMAIFLVCFCIIAKTQTYSADEYKHNENNWSLRESGEDLQIYETEESKEWALFDDDWGLRLTGAPNLSLNGVMYSNGRNLTLEAASGYYVELKSKSSSYGLIVREYNSSDYGNIEVTSSGLGLGYNTSGSHLSIAPNGNVGIGLTSQPSHKLQVNGSLSANSIYSNNVGQYGYGCLINATSDLAKAYSVSNSISNEEVFIVWGNGIVNTKKIYAEAFEVRPDAFSINWFDEVFLDNYELRSLSDVESFVQKNKHLPDIPSEKTIKTKGFNMAQMDGLLLKKIEELTLYLIQQQKEIDYLKQQLKK